MNYSSPLQRLPDVAGVTFWVKRDDLLHPLVSGNKFRKLKYNLLAARQRGFTTLLTFGGAYSNHLYATAAAGQLFGFKTIGLVRGEELAGKPLNATLQFCHDAGMALHYVSRDEYRRKDDADYVATLPERFGPCYVLPEGGTNELAVQGTAEILPELTAQLGRSPDYMACAVGTGGTVAGLVQSATSATEVLGVMALKGFVPDVPGATFFDTYHFGGYARHTPELLQFIRQFEAETGILLEQIYTGKLFFALHDLARQGFFRPGSRVVALHTGGLQGRLPTL